MWFLSYFSRGLAAPKFSQLVFISAYLDSIFPFYQFLAIFFSFEVRVKGRPASWRLLVQKTMEITTFMRENNGRTQYSTASKWAAANTILLHRLYVIWKYLGRSQGHGGRGRKGKKEGEKANSFPKFARAWRCVSTQWTPESFISFWEKQAQKKTISFCSSSRLWQSLLLVRLRRRGVVGGLGGSSDGGVVPASNCFQPYYSW